MSIVQNEPVLTAAGVTGALIAIAAIFGIGLDTDTVETIVTAALPIILAVIARHYVTPTAKVSAPVINTPTAGATSRHRP